MRRFGFSTGALALADFRRALEMLSTEPTIAVVELSALREHELEPLVGALDLLDFEQFSYVAVHAPSRIDPRHEARVVDVLGGVATRRWPIVVHPDAIHDWSLWRSFGSLLCVENMDKRKAIGRNRAELHACFDWVPDASLCFDLGHARQVDPSMTEAFLMLRDFGDRLQQVHVSEVSTDSKHDRLSFTASLAFREVASLIPDRIPIVLETPVEASEFLVEIGRAREALPSGPRARARQAATSVSA